MATVTHTASAATVKLGHIFFPGARVMVPRKDRTTILDSASVNRAIAATPAPTIPATMRPNPVCMGATPPVELDCVFPVTAELAGFVAADLMLLTAEDAASAALMVGKVFRRLDTNDEASAEFVGIANPVPRMLFAIAEASAAFVGIGTPGKKELNNDEAPARSVGIWIPCPMLVSTRARRKIGTML
ncbi:hypothetical protein FH972_026933 [Carpinus fangiana]|uniref:Uncharacterized protein n=1 Tax=Carpinus fangiana TaxID=176857 RepID=A0A5N6L5F6_9ROSI|nr:hypothetical protein FH972_026933 [Carpinus fangiana]